MVERSPSEERAGGYEALYAQPALSSGWSGYSFMPNPAYDQYCRMNKVLVGTGGAEQLVDIHDQLSNETLPRYQTAAGWAAAEAGLVDETRSLEERIALLDDAVTCWTSALQMQQKFNASAPECLIDYDYPYRIALDIALSPLLKGIITGAMDTGLTRSVYEDCLSIAQMNIVQMRLHQMNGNEAGYSDHLGLGYECNALLAFNQSLSKSWFAILSMARCDTGYHYKEQSHDLVVLHHRKGKIESALPAEVKASGKVYDRRRYDALLLRGKLHLSVPGKYTPDHTLRALTAVYDGTATKEELASAREVSERVTGMVRRYYSGQAIGQVANHRTVTRFRDNTLVAAVYPGIKRPAA